MSLKEYSLKFTQLSKYAPTLVSYSRERINKFVMGVSSMVDNEFGVLDPMEPLRGTKWESLYEKILSHCI